MGKKLRVQRRGRGTPTFRAAKTGKVAPARYPSPTEEGMIGVVKDLIHERGRGAPLAYVELGGGLGYYHVAPEGVQVGQSIAIGSEAPIQVGNILPLEVIPEGTLVCNVELKPGDGGRVARSSGSYATVVAHIGTDTILQLPSKKTIRVPKGCRATIGVVAGGGRKDKPFLKAGEVYHLTKAKGRVFPRSKGISMTAASHPHGGGRHRHIGKPSTVARSTPPGRKVGLIAARRSGRKKRMRRERERA
ncbi:MAG: 50S ribosomal protein L2 [Candidatus Bathyarchaeia archaeon]